MTELIAVDTEWARGKPWCLSFSDEPGKSRVIMADQTDALARLNARLSNPGTITIIQNCLYDLPVLDRMGVRPFKVIDTMIAAYLLCVEPQALKTLAYRHLGMEMHEYADMVRPATIRKALGYLGQVVGLPWPKPSPVEVWEKSKRRLKQPQNIEKKAWRIIKDTIEKDSDPWERWHNIEVEEGRGLVEAVLGSMQIGDLSDIDRDAAIRYSARDADATLRLYHVLWPRIVADGLEDCFWADMGAIPMIVDMMRVGIRIDPDHFRELSIYLRDKAAETRTMILTKLRGMGIDLADFNPNSWPQVAWVLYEKLGLVTANGSTSTDAKTLSTLLESGSLTPAQHEIVSGVQDYRTYIKLKGTYADTIPLLADKNSRVHTTFKVTRTATGRLSSASPNLQNQPVRSEEGRKLRDGFVAPDGCKLLSVDLSQIEMRCAAHLSQDPEMVRIFLDDLDLHSQTAARIFGVSLDQVDEKKHRYPAKCFHPDTEVLTPTGWVKMKDLHGGPICQATPQHQIGVKLEWTSSYQLQFKQNHCSHLVHLKNEGIDIRVTPDHRMLEQTAHGIFQVKTPAEFVKCRHFWNSGMLNTGSWEVDETLLRLAVATQADGSYNRKKIRFGFSRTRKIERMRQLLSGLDYSEAEHRNGMNGTVRAFSLGRELTEAIKNILDPDKTLSWRMLNLTPYLRSVVLDEAKLWDGHTSRWQCSNYSSSIKKNCDILQAMAAITNRKTRLAQPGIWDLTIRQNSRSRGGNIKLTEIPYSDEIAMLSAPSTFILARDGGIPVIVGQTVGFGVLYGMQPEGLQATLATKGVNWTTDDCARMIDEWFKIYSGVRGYMNGVHDHARRFGYVVDMFGRRRYIPHARSQDRRLQAAAMREAGNFPVQSSAQGIIKRAMGSLVPVYREWRRLGVVWDPLVQIHDEILSQVEDAMVYIVARIQIIVMETVIELSVPVKADGKAGVRWGQLEKIKEAQ